MGVSTSTAANQSKGLKTAEEQAEIRRKETFGENNVVESNKRGRTDYAESLRKKRM